MAVAIATPQITEEKHVSATECEEYGKAVKFGRIYERLLYGSNYLPAAMPSDFHSDVKNLQFEGMISLNRAGIYISPEEFDIFYGANPNEISTSIGAFGYLCKAIKARGADSVMVQVANDNSFLRFSHEGRQLILLLGCSRGLISLDYVDHNRPDYKRNFLRKVWRLPLYPFPGKPTNSAGKLKVPYLQ